MAESILKIPASNMVKIRDKKSTILKVKGIMFMSSKTPMCIITATSIINCKWFWAISMIITIYDNNLF
ncbi:hypothetical protein DSECCO2_610180 [anaerobic digester metagenome]